MITGFARLALDKINLLPDGPVKNLSLMRMDHCNACPMRVGNTCSKSKIGINVITGKQVRGCGCNLAAKTLEEKQKCPLGKW